MKFTIFSTLKVILRALLFTVLTLFILFSTWVLWERNRDTLRSIDLHPGKVELTKHAPYHLSLADTTDKTYHHIVLGTQYLGDIQAFISKPKVIPKEGLPVVIIMGGLQVGADTFKLIDDSGENIYIVFKYPYSPEYWYKGTPIIEIPVIRRSVLRVPSQTLTLYEWISEQPWTKKEYISFAGFSFGAMFIPSIYHLANSHNKVLNPGVIAYAGADLYDLLYTNMDKIDAPWRSFAAWLGETTIYSIEPAHHLPHMNNEFLLINATKDHQISTYSWKKLHELTPEPKTVMILDEGHMHPRKPELTKKIEKISMKWLKERGLVN